MANIVKKPVTVNVSLSMAHCKDIKSVFFLFIFSYFRSVTLRSQDVIYLWCLCISQQKSPRNPAKIERVSNQRLHILP